MKIIARVTERLPNCTATLTLLLSLTLPLILYFGSLAQSNIPMFLMYQSALAY